MAATAATALMLGGMTATLAASAAFAAPAVSWEAQTNSCFFSWQDTDPATGIAYAIVENNDPSHLCHLQVTARATGALIAEVVATNTPAVVYIAAAGRYDYALFDDTVGSGALGAIAFTGTPAVPAMPSGTVTTNGCVVGLQQRSVVGHLATYASGFNVQQNSAGVACTHTVTSSPAIASAYSAAITTNMVQIAVPDPFGLNLTKSMVDEAGTAITTANEGDIVTYVFAVDNTSFMPLEFSVQDPLPGLSSVSCPANTVDANSRVTCTATYVVSAADASVGAVSNTATVHGIDTVRPNATGAAIPDSSSSARVTVASASVIPAVVPSAAPTPPSMLAATDIGTLSNTVTGTAIDPQSGSLIGTDSVDVLVTAAAEPVHGGSASLAITGGTGVSFAIVAAAVGSILTLAGGMYLIGSRRRRAS
ncbi:hypothetical protein ASD13_05215 [Microbacterium sp. Root1433D1]|uniref:DUF7507 domain-containing protein n=1 Tax=Microbacterium TaxID=33882 RepID=UPI0006FD5ACF|nr:hypothetical protein [Microbacterium sp. Root1433D1]KQY78056.1 hypothetical protein ASD13_05215 [Microbacterium sp. Root1433D1]